MVLVIGVVLWLIFKLLLSHLMVRKLVFILLVIKVKTKERLSTKVPTITFEENRPYVITTLLVLSRPSSNIRVSSLHTLSQKMTLQSSSIHQRFYDQLYCLYNNLVCSIFFLRRFVSYILLIRGKLPLALSTQNSTN